jgi:hypothetical protein
MWSGSSNTVCDGNVFIDCERAIAFGLGPQAGFANSHSGGIICNNFVHAGVACASVNAPLTPDAPPFPRLPDLLQWLSGSRRHVFL